MWGERETPDWPCLGSGSSKEGPGSLTAALDKPGFPLVTRLAAGWTQWWRGEGSCRGAGVSAALVPPTHTHKVPPFVEEFNTIQHTVLPRAAVCPPGGALGKEASLQLLVQRVPGPGSVGNIPRGRQGSPSGCSGLSGAGQAGGRAGLCPTEPRTGASVSPCPGAQDAQL